MSEEFARKHNVVVLPSDRNIQTVLGTGAVVGITKEYIITVMGNYECSVQFYVIRRQHHELVLGANWMKAMNAGIHYDDGLPIITFNHASFGLDTDHHSNDYYNHDVISSNNRRQDNMHSLHAVAISSTEQAISSVDDDELEFDYDWDLQPDQVVIKPEIELKAPKHQKHFKLLTREIRRASAKSLSELGSKMVGEHVITLVDEIPVTVHPYRKSAKEKELIEKEVKMLLDAKIIRPSKSDYCAPLILVNKKDGGTRMVLNYKQLNVKTKTEPFPLPRVDDILDTLAASRYYTKMDLKSGFYQIPLAENSKRYTAFSTPNGSYEFNNCPFGLKNLPFDFSRIMSREFSDLKYVEVFIDDIIVHDNDLAMHLEHVGVVVERLINVGLRLNLSKCVWVTDELKVLGHKIKAGFILMDEAKVEAISKRLPPTNLKQLQSFLGICNYYRKFVKAYAEKAKPLVLLLCKDTRYVWSAECQLAFERLRDALVSYPILRAPNYNYKFVLHCDASGYAIGVVLTQTDENGVEYVVAYGARTQTRHEIHYTITEKECLAVVWGIKHFRSYLFGAKFDVVTDHSALKWLMTIKDPTGRLARWGIYLQAYDMTIIHRAGTNHANADALSRPVNAITLEPELQDDEHVIDHDPYANDQLMHYLKFGRHANGTSKSSVKKVLALVKKFRLVANELQVLHNGQYLIYPHKEEKVELINRFHSLGHFKAASTYQNLLKEYYWKGMPKQVVDFVSRCMVCNRNDRVAPINHPALALEVTGIFDKVGIDLAFGFPVTSEGYKGILVMTEFLSNFAYVVPIKSKAASEIANHLLSYISLFSPPKSILSDLGKEFNNEIVDNLLRKVGVDHNYTSGWNPSTNGKCERLNRTLIDCLRKHSETNTSIWPEWIPSIILAYNSRVHSTTGYTPFELVFGRRMNHFENWAAKKPIEDVVALQNRVDEIHKLVVNDHQTVIALVKEKQFVQKQTQDSNKTITESILTPGTTVMLRNDGILQKLDPKAQGPHTIIDKTSMGNYQIMDTTDQFKKLTVPRHKLKVIPTPDIGDDDYHEIKQVVNHRIRNKLTEYEVIWASDNSRSWIPVRNFNSMAQINEYHQNHVPKRRGRKPKEINSFNMVPRQSFVKWLCIILHLTYWLSVPCQAQTIARHFDYCDITNDMPYWDEQVNCRPKSIIGLKIPGISDGSGTYTILSKMHDVVNGEGIQCFKTKHVHTFSETFWGQRVQSVYTENVPLTKSECAVMSERKLCGETEQMECMGSNCWFTPNVKPIYDWFSPTTITVFSCSTVVKLIVASSPQSRLFGTKCIATDNECSFHDSIIIWNDNIIHKICPFNRLMTTTLNQSDDYLVNKNYQILLQYSTLVDYCDTKMILTTEGLYLLPHIPVNEPIYTTIDKAFPHLDQRALTDLQLSDHDYETFMISERERQLRQTVCDLSMVQLWQMKQSINTFVFITDDSGNPLVLYNDDSALVIPTCIALNKVEIIISTKNCYLDFPVKITVQNTSTTAFLTRERVVKKFSKIVECNNNTEKRIFFPDLQINLIKLGNKQRIEKTTKKLKQIDPRYNFKKFNFQHSNLVVESIDSVGDFLKLTANKDGDNTLIIVNTQVEQESTRTIDHTPTHYIYHVMKSLGIISTLIIFVGGILLLVIFFKPIRNSLTTINKICKKKETSIHFNATTEAISMLDREINLMEERLDTINIKSITNDKRLSLIADNIHETINEMENEDQSTIFKKPKQRLYSAETK